MTDAEPLSPGWAAILTGHDFDLDYWLHSLMPSFDPWVERGSDGSGIVHVLRSASLNALTEAREVKERSVALIEQLNGAQAVLGGAKPLKFGGVLRVERDGKVHRTVFAEALNLLGRMSLTAKATVIGANGKPVPPPAPSAAQRWIAAAETNDDIADMLAFSGRTESWYDIYKAYELAQRLAGGRHRLPKLLGSSASDCENVRLTANYYRHARAHRPDPLTTIEEAQPLIAFVIRSVLDHVLPG